MRRINAYESNDYALKIADIDSIKVKIDDGVIRTIMKVQHVKDLKKNLLSMGQLNDLGYEFHGKRGILKVIKGALIVMKAKKIATCCIRGQIRRWKLLLQTLEKNWQ